MQQDTCHRGAPRVRATRVLAGVALCALAGAAIGSAATGPRGAPPRLAETGLYSDFASRTVAPGNLHYSPQYPLWTDGATKNRWIRLPPGTAIDAREPDRWVFPVGTRIWKEFAWSRPVETRYLEKTRRGWIYAAYVWSEDGSDAALAPEGGVRSTQEVAPGRLHRIPSVSDCRSCHEGGRAHVLGFGALQLSSDRDPLAPNAESLRPGDATLETLVRRGLVRGLPRRLVERPPRVAADTPRGRAAMGYLHANCSICHDSAGPMRGLGVSLRHALDARAQADEPAVAGIGHATRYAIPGAPPDRSVWIDPGSPATSAVFARMVSRSPVAQMPPLGTQVVDAQAVAVLRGWIEEDLRPPSR